MQTNTLLSITAFPANEPTEDIISTSPKENTSQDSNPTIFLIEVKPNTYLIKYSNSY